jgi:hypothetical protein
VSGDVGQLTVRDSVLSQNGVGVQVASTVALLERTVIRDTGRKVGETPGGIAVFAVPYGGESYPLAQVTLRRCLVTGSRVNNLWEGAVTIASSKATLERTVIRETSIAEGIKAQATGMGLLTPMVVSHEDTPSTIAISDCLVASNTAIGISLHSSTAKIERSVLRDTRSVRTADGDDMGDGIHATIATGLKKLPVVEMNDCLVTENERAGVRLSAGDGTITRSIIRDARPGWGAGAVAGYGVVAAYDRLLMRPSTLVLRQSLVAGNRTVGVSVTNSQATLEASVVRDTRVHAADGAGGVGLWLGWEDYPVAPSASVEDCLFANNQTSAVLVDGGDLTMKRTVARDSLPQANGHYGIGVTAFYRDKSKRGSKLHVTDSVLANNRTHGLLLFGSTATLKRSAVRETRVRASDGKAGTGITLTDNTGGVSARVPSSLALLESEVAGSPNAGIDVMGGSSARIYWSAVRATRGIAGTRGDGLTVSGKGSKLELVDSLVDESLRAGLLVMEGGGAARRSVFRRGLLPIHLPSESPFEVGADNVYLDNTENRVTHGKGYKPSPLPDRPPSHFK